MGQRVAVFGAYGHTGRFVVTELRERGFVPLLLGRDESRLAASGLAYRVASVDDPASLDQALIGADAVINCAGPFASTAAPVIEAALRAGIPYVDVAAEIEANVDTFAHFGKPARAAGISVVPAMAFFGGLGDLLVTTAMGDWTSADEAHVAYGLSSWHPTAGTVAAGAVSRERRADVVAGIEPQQQTRRAHATGCAGCQPSAGAIVSASVRSRASASSSDELSDCTTGRK
ncbi:NAD(P)H-binding protein [Micromonospora zamorensis]|uniref:NAD(P)H-binding protein n=1 Tax=Micromonospora zamorensis TaxID=709883 RepID=UPI0033EAD8D1